LQGDKPVYVTEPEESEYTMVVVLYSPQYREMQHGRKTEKKNSIGEGKHG
jgi:hypothetical protein